MDDVTSNAIEVQKEFLDLIAGFNLTLPGRDQSIGRDMAVAAAGGIVVRTVIDQEDSSGNPLKPNNPKYAARKLKEHDVSKVGILTGQMLSMASVMGKVAVGPESVEVSYGTGEKPSAYATRGTITGKEPTDVQKAGYFADRGNEFFDLDATIEDEIFVVARDGLAAYLEDR